MTVNTLDTLSPDERLKDKHPAFVSYRSHLIRRGCSIRTIESYSDCIVVLIGWLNGRSPLELSARDLESFRGWLVNDYRSGQGRSVAVGRQSYYVAVLRGFYTYCRRQRLILSNPAADLAYPKQPKRLHRDILTPDELRRLLASPDASSAGIRDQVALRIMALSGLRVSEAASVVLDDLNLPDRELVVRRGKGGHQRLTFIDRISQRVIAAYLAWVRPRIAASGAATLLVDDHGHVMNRSQVRAIVHRHVRAAAIAKPVGCHSLRRSFATLLLASRTPGGGMNIKVLAELMGHQKLGTTARYAQVNIESLSAVYREAHPRAVSTPAHHRPASKAGAGVA